MDKPCRNTAGLRDSEARCLIVCCAQCERRSLETTRAESENLLTEFRSANFHIVDPTRLLLDFTRFSVNFHQSFSFVFSIQFNLIFSLNQFDSISPRFHPVFSQFSLEF